MNIDLKISNIKDKISSSNYKFTSEEVFIITRFPEVLKIYLDSIKKNKNTVTYEDVKDIISVCDESLFDQELFEIFARLMIDNEEVFTLEYIERIEEECNLKGKLDDLKAKSINYTKDYEKLLNSKETFYGTEVVDMLLDEKKYDILSKVYCPGSLNKKQKERLIKEFPFAKYPNTKLYDLFSLEEILELDPTNVSANTYLTKYYNEEYFDEKRINHNSKLYKILVNKLQDSNQSFELEYEDLIYPFIDTIEPENDRELYILLDKKDSLLAVDASLEIGVAKIERVVYRIKKYLLNHKKLPHCITNSEDIVNVALTDDEIIRLLIDNLEISILLDCPILDEYEDLLVSKIEENKEKISEIGINNINRVFKYKKLTNILLKYGSYGMIDFSSYDNLIDQDNIIDILDNASFKTIRLNGKIIKNNKEYFKNRINNDLEYAIRFFNEYVSTVIFDYNLLNEFLDLYINLGDIFADKVIDFIVHNGDIEKLQNEKNYQLTKKYIANKYNLKLENLDYIESKLGPKIISYYGNEQIRYLINLPKESIDKILNLFSIENYKMSDVEAVYDSIKQNSYQKEEPETFSIFSDILQSINDKTNYYLEAKTKILPYLDEKFINELNENIDAKYELKDIDHLYDLIIAKLKENNPEKIEKYQVLLHYFTSYYIKQKREEYRSKIDIDKEINFKQTIDPKKNESLLIKVILTSDKYSYYKELIKNEIVPQVLEESLFNDCINYYLDKNSFLTNDIKEVQKKISTIIKVARKVASNIEIDQIDTLLQGYESEIKYDKSFTQNNPDILAVISNIKLQTITEKLLTNDDAYNCLCDIMKKRKLLSFPKELSEFLENNGYTFDTKDIASFITYFYKIYIHEQEKSGNKKVTFTIPNIFANIEAYGCFSAEYIRVLGAEDARLIKTNPGPNNAYLANEEERLTKALERTIKNFERKVVRIPTFNEIVDCGNNKQLRVICGNFTHPSNLTHGERTGACMRIGGVGESLFNFCLDNEFGFHIRFEDPNTGKYISRVSGFRNGNTVFLNQLRFSCKEDYNNFDLEEACKKASDILIEMSKDSSCPIENVVISNFYAMTTSKRKCSDLKVDNIKQGIGNFYSDVTGYAIVLSTTAKGEYKEVNLDNSQVPKYLPAREKVKTIYTEEDMLKYIYRIETIRNYIENGINLIDTITLDKGFVYGMVNQDWYVYVDNNKVIHSNLINVDYRAEIELNKAIEEIKQKYNIEVGDKYGL